jgi:hypothetical protein
MTPKDVNITITEPWELVSEIDSAKVTGEIRLQGQGSIIIGLQSPLKLRGSEYNWLLATPRHAGESLDLPHGKVFCNFSSMTDAEEKEGIPAAPSRFAGELNMLGDLEW